ncbi:MAG: GerMN domain-containing protein [Actinomycetota bacterium]
MKRTFSIVLVLLALVFSACADDETDAASTATSPAPEQTTGSPSAEPSEEPITFTEVELWFVRPDGVSVAVREVPDEEAIGTRAMTELLNGPSALEAETEMTTAIPEGTELLGLDISEGTATVDLSDEFDDGGGSASMLARVAQVVYTLTQFPTVDAVAFEMEGEPLDTLGGEGLVLEEPQTRSDHEDELAPIQVLKPAPGEEFYPGDTIIGTANVFEATVSYRLLGPLGQRLAKGFTTATCGTGCRGDYEETITWIEEAEGIGIVEVFESSAEDGSPIHMVRIPVVLVPAP